MEPPVQLGSTACYFSETDKNWTVPTEVWHTDFDFVPTTEPAGTMVFGFLSEVGERGGGTVVIEGSHRLVKQFVDRHDSGFLSKMKRVRLALMESETWLRDLATSGDPDERNQRFIHTETVSGVPLRVVELTGQPGDVVLCQPWLLHAVAPNCSEQPRMMCVQRIHTFGHQE